MQIISPFFEAQLPGAYYKLQLFTCTEIELHRRTTAEIFQCFLRLAAIISAAYLNNIGLAVNEHCVRIISSFSKTAFPGGYIPTSCRSIEDKDRKLLKLLK